METFKTTVDWSKILLTFQNCDQPGSFCDLKLECSDGYILLHRVVVPRLNKLRPPESVENSLDLSWDPYSSIIVLPNLTLLQVSKLALLLYTGEIFATKADHVVLKQLFNVFGISPTSVKFSPLPRNVTNTRTKTSAKGTPYDPELKREQLAQQKVRVSKFLSTSHEDTEKIFIYGDGSTMAVPLPPQEDISVNCAAILYDEEGHITNNNANGFSCTACSMIFCHSSDFLNHSLKCTKKQALPPTPRAIKIDCSYIKLESVQEEPEPDSDSTARSVGSISVCLICVTSCKDASELIIHSDRQHTISPAKDYDIGNWKCRRCCKRITSNNELSVFLQHVYNCGRNKRKRATSCTSERPAIHENDVAAVVKRPKRPKRLDYGSITHQDEISPDLTTGPSSDVIENQNRAEEEPVTLHQPENHTIDALGKEAVNNLSEGSESSQLIIISSKTQMETKSSNSKNQYESVKQNSFKIPKVGQGKIQSQNNVECGHAKDAHVSEYSECALLSSPQAHPESEQEVLKTSNHAYVPNIGNDQRTLSKYSKEFVQLNNKSPLEVGWKCRRCKKVYNIQKIYMQHECVNSH